MKRSQTRGFTLIELNLAMIFVAILVIGVAATAISVTKINQRGVMLKTINQTGREVMEQMRRDIAAAKTDQVQYIAPVGGVGRLCLGTVSYTFNTAEALALGSAGTIRDTTKADQPTITLVRMQDKGSEWCRQISGVFVKNQVTAPDEAVELLQTDQLPVAIHSMDVKPLAQTVSSSATQGLVSLTMILGTNEASTIRADAVACKPPTDHQTNFDNCAVREFHTVIRSSGIE